MRTLCLILLLAFLAAACGQKGPLVLPKDKDKPEMTEEGTPRPKNGKK